MGCTEGLFIATHCSKGDERVYSGLGNFDSRSGALSGVKLAKRFRQTQSVLVQFFSLPSASCDIGLPSRS